jgi:hypothetical protein
VTHNLMTDDLVALKNNRGADEANVDCVSYPRQPDGTFLMPEDVAQSLLALPAGFYRAAPDDDRPTRQMTMDFLGTPFMSYEIGGRRFDADENGIIADVPPGNFGALLNMGAIPLPPPGWVDPRKTIAA